MKSTRRADRANMEVQEVPIVRFKTIVGIAALALIAPVIANGDEAALRKYLMTDFDRRAEQFRKKDIKGFMTMYTADFKGVNMEGKPVSRQQVEAQMKQAMRDTKSMDTAKLNLDKVTMNGENAATVESTMTLKMKVADSVGQFGKKGQVHAVGMIERTREGIVKTKDGWKVKTSQPLPGGAMSLDGKPFPPPAPPKKEKK